MAEADFSRYLTHSAEDVRWQMVCTDVGMTRVPPGSPYPPHGEEHPEAFRSVSVGRRINEFQIVYIPFGEGKLECGAKRSEIKAGTVFLLFPGVPHAYCPNPATGWVEYWVGFCGPHFDTLLRSGIIGPDQALYRPGYQASLIGSFLSIFELAGSQAPLYQPRICSEILNLLAETLSLDRLSRQQDRGQAVVEQAKAYIEANIRADFDLESLGATLKVSLPQMNEVFKAYTGMTPYQYCIHAKINRAKEILASGETSVKQIAWQVGFEDPYYFSRLFRKKTGRCPRDFIGEARVRSSPPPGRRGRSP
jgi:AraC-like DNA-binding protein